MKGKEYTENGTREKSTGVFSLGFSSTPWEHALLYTVIRGWAADLTNAQGESNAYFAGAYVCVFWG